MKKTSKLLIGSLSGAALFALMTYAIYPRIERSTQPDLTDPLDWITFILPYRARFPKNLDETLKDYSIGKDGYQQTWFEPILLQKVRTGEIFNVANTPKLTEPVEGGSCSDMQNYFNQNFGRSDTTFSNYEGTIQKNFLGMLVCSGGVAIQSLPTGKKTCSAWIRVLGDKSLDWWAESDGDCFVSQ